MKYQALVALACLMGSCAVLKDPVAIQETEAVLDRVITDETIGTQPTPTTSMPDNAPSLIPTRAAI
jgi:hypothetical protein